MFIRLCTAAAAACLMSFATLAHAASPAPTDPQIAHIAYTAGALDVAVAKEALGKTKTKAVKEFADEMVRDHEAVNKQALELVKKLNVTLENNDTSRALTKQIKEEETKLAKLNGAAFDKAYIDHEVAFHKTVNNALTSTLIPSAKNPELKAFLETGLKIFQGHLQHAEHIAATLK
jgi:putative membrane protein